MKEKEKMRRVGSGKAKKKVSVIVAVIYQFNVSREKTDVLTNEIDGSSCSMDVMNVPVSTQ